MEIAGRGGGAGRFTRPQSYILRRKIALPSRNTDVFPLADCCRVSAQQCSAHISRRPGRAIPSGRTESRCHCTDQRKSGRLRRSVAVSKPSKITIGHHVFLLQMWKKSSEPNSEPQGEMICCLSTSLWRNPRSAAVRAVGVNLWPFRARLTYVKDGVRTTDIG